MDNQRLLKQRFEKELDAWNFGGKEMSVVVVAVKLPNGAIETIQNTQSLWSKVDYYRTMYDDEFRLKANPAVEIIGYMIA